MTETIKGYLIDLFSHYNRCANSLASEIENPGLSDKEKLEVAKELTEAQRHRDTLKKCIYFYNTATILAGQFTRIIG